MSDATESSTGTKIALALSGGGSRAIAFHLGCLRTLHRRGLLDRVEVISSVSGGSVISAMYAYSDDSFESFDQRVVSLLRKGLQWRILRMCLRPDHLTRSAITLLVSGLPVLGITALNLGIRLLNFLLKLCRTERKVPTVVMTPIRFHSRTNAFQAVLEKFLYCGSKLPGVKRRKCLDVVINATDLTTSSAFRFGSRVSHCWRHGSVHGNGELPVAMAVAASAAFPPLLPALDLSFDFHKEESGDVRKRVLLTDGGVYDNLGISCLEPGRNGLYTSIRYDNRFLIVCDAGHGMPPGTSRSFFWPSRMSHAFSTVFKKSVDGQKKLLHEWGRSHGIGFIYAFLGQQDSKLGATPIGFVGREKVNSYPTDFASMSAENVALLTRRGEQLVEALLRMYGEP